MTFAFLALTAPGVVVAINGGDSPAPGISPAASGRDLRLPAGKSMLRVGYGKADITPELGTPCALGLDDELLEVFDPLYVRSVWLESGGQTVLILTADVIGVNGDDAGTSYVVPQVYFDEGGYEPTATRLAPAAYVELREKMISLLTSVGLTREKPAA